jgi:Pregnancy-associated plasma protein-A/GEVED domain
MRRIKLTMAGLVLATTSMMAQQAPLNQPVYKIPVKVHVLSLAGQPSRNAPANTVFALDNYITNANVTEGIRILNQQLAGSNGASPLNIELVQVDGVNRHPVEERFAAITTYDNLNQVLGMFKDNTPQNQVLNLYVVPKVYGGNAIAHLPSLDGNIVNEVHETRTNGGIIMTAGYWPTHTSPGVVWNANRSNINYGVRNQGSLTHEIGHYFGLKHTFESGCDNMNDGIHDTPSHENNLEGQVDATQAGLCAGQAAGNLVSNYMTYSAVQSQFTNGQVAKMQEVLENNSRNSLWQIPNLIKHGVIKSKNQTASNRTFVSASLSRFNTTDGTDTNTELNNVDRANRYTDNTITAAVPPVPALARPVTPGKYQFKATLAPRPAGNNSNSRVALWIDFNANLNAEDGEVFHSTAALGAGTQLNFEVNVPESMAKDRDILARLILTQREAQLTSPEITAHSQLGEVAVPDFAANVIDYKFNYSPNNAATLRNQYIVADFKESINRVAGVNDSVHTNASKLKYNDFSTGTIQLTTANNTLAIRVDKSQSIQGGQQSYVVAWVDWDGNGTFDAAERQHANIAVNGNNNVSTNLNITIPDTAKLGKTYKLLVGSGLSAANPVVGNDITLWDTNTQRNLYSLKLAKGYCQAIQDNPAKPDRLSAISFGEDVLSLPSFKTNYKKADKEFALSNLQSYAVKVTYPKTSDSYHMADLFIDYNKNGLFENNETERYRMSETDGGLNSTNANNLKINKAYKGIHSARIKTYINDSGNPTDHSACSDDSGQTVDFTINITDSFCTPSITSRDASYNLLSNRISSVRVGNTTIAANETAVQFAEKVVADNSEKAYNDYSAQNILPLTTAAAGNAVTVTVKDGTANATAQVFVDWNNNGTFEAAESIASGAFANNAATATLIAPATAVKNVPLRMRIITNSALSCPADNAQVYISDYLVNLTTPPVVAPAVRAAARVGAEETVADNWQIAPVPSRGDVNLNSPRKTSAKIYNTLGQQVHALELEAGANALNLSHLGQGVFYILDDQMLLSNLKVIINP